MVAEVPTTVGAVHKGEGYPAGEIPRWVKTLFPGSDADDPAWWCWIYTVPDGTYNIFLKGPRTNQLILVGQMPPSTTPTGVPSLGG